MKNRKAEKGMVRWMWGLLALVGAAYLLNLGFGIIEFIPDNTPLIGNIDEFIATIALLKGLRETTGAKVV